MQRGPGEYGDLLRVIGRLLDERDAETRSDSGGNQTTAPGAIRDAEIIEHETFMTVYWTGGGSIQEQSYTDSILSELRAAARQLRGTVTGHASGDRSALLRALGDALDAEGINLTGIVEKDHAFVVSGVADGRYINRWYAHDDLRALHQQRQPLRSPDQ